MLSDSSASCLLDLETIDVTAYLRYSPQSFPRRLCAAGFASKFPRLLDSARNFINTNLEWKDKN